MVFSASSRRLAPLTAASFVFILVLTMAMGFLTATTACRHRNKAVTTPVAELSFTNELGMTFVYIHPGQFMMGSPKDERMRDNDEKRHGVRLTVGFYIQTTEVTQGQWQAVMGDQPSSFKNCGDSCPVEQVSWNDVQMFISRLNEKANRIYRLPTEAEWEYACRAGTTGAFNTGDCLPSDQVNFDGDFPLPGCPEGLQRQATVAVEHFAPNAWGLYDMHGNVWEWCADQYGPYHVSKKNNPAVLSGGVGRVFRGGGWSSGARGCRSAERNWRSSDFSGSFIGFRLAVDQ